MAHAEEPAFYQVTQIARRPFCEVGQPDGIGEHVVSVETQQGVAVEKQCRNAADQHEVEGQGVHEPRLCVEPEHQRQHRDKQFDHDADGAHRHAVPFLREGIRR